VAIHYKGSGFYATDYGRGSSRQAKEASSDSGAGSTKSESRKETGKAAGDS
jgi:predicted nucleic acid-binding Zn ribbon protein